MPGLRTRRIPGIAADSHQDAEHLVVQLQDLLRQEGLPDQGHAGRDDPQEDLPVVPRVLHRQGQA